MKKSSAKDGLEHYGLVQPRVTLGGNDGTKTPTPADEG